MKTNLKIIALLCMLLLLCACKYFGKDPSLCANYGCYEQVALGSIYCDKHKSQINNDANTATTEATTEAITEATTFPTVPYADIKNGAYNSQTVNIDGIVGSMEDSIVSLHFDAWINNNGKTVFNEFIISDDDELYNYAISNLKTGNSYTFTVNVYDDATKGNSIGSVVNIIPVAKEAITIDAIKQMYASSCVRINASDLARNPEQYEYKTDVAMSGEVLQVAEEYESSEQLLLDTGGDNGVVNVYYNKPQGAARVLEGDYITAYGNFTHMYDYTSVLGTKKSIPSIVCKFID